MATIPVKANLDVDGTITGAHAGDGSALTGLTVSVPIGPNVPTGNIDREYRFNVSNDGWISNDPTNMPITWDASNFALLANSADIEGVFYAYEPGGLNNPSEYEMEFDITIVAGNAAAVLFNITSDTDYNMITVVNDQGTDPGVYLIDRTNSVYSVIGRHEGIIFSSAPLPIRILIRRILNMVSVYVNGSFVFTGTVPNATNSRVGFTSINGTARLDNVRVYKDIDPYRPLGGTSVNAKNVSYDRSFTNLANNAQDALDALHAQVVNAGGTDSYIVSGGGIGNESGMTLTISPATYYICGKLYTSQEQNISIGAGHSSLNRIDLLCLGTNGVAVVVQGSPANIPVRPVINEGTLVELSEVRVYAQTESLAATRTRLISDSSSWRDLATASPSFNLASTVTPRTGITCVEVTSPFNGDSVTLRAAVSAGGLSSAMVFYIKRKEADWGNRYYTFQIQKDGVKIGRQISLRNKLYGFDLSKSGYQQVVIPFEDFGIKAENYINELVITHRGADATGSEGIYIDDSYIAVAYYVRPKYRLTTIRTIETDLDRFEMNGRESVLAIKGLNGITTSSNPEGISISWASDTRTIDETSGTINYTAGNERSAVLNLEGNAVLNVGIASYPNQALNLIVMQRNGGNHTLTINGVNMSDDIPAVSISTAESTYTRIGLIANPDGGFDVGAIQRGYQSWE